MNQSNDIAIEVTYNIDGKPYKTYFTPKGFKDFKESCRQWGIITKKLKRKLFYGSANSTR